MIVEFADWRFRVDINETRERTNRYSQDHCMCDYCRNFYDTVDQAHPYLRTFLKEFGICLEGPCELVPFEPTLMLVCYRIDGMILQWGKTPLHINGIPIVPEAGEEGTFLLWIGELELPWIQETPMDEVVSPANLPEFMERMQTLWQLRHGTDFVFS